MRSWLALLVLVAVAAFVFADVDKKDSTAITTGSTLDGETGIDTADGQTIVSSCDPCSPTFFTSNTTNFNSNTYATLLSGNQIEATTTDDTIYQGLPTANYYGPCDYIFMGGTGSTKYRAFVTYDLTQIPSSATISAVEFWLRGRTWNMTIDVDVYRVTTGTMATASSVGTCGSTNDSTAVDWNNYSGSNAWTASGGDYDSTVLTTLDCGSSIVDVWVQGANVSTCGGGSDDCLVEAVQGIVDGTYSNYGFILIAEGSSANNRWDNSIGPDGERPYLKVTWS